MAKKPRTRRKTQADEIKELINRSASLQIEMLGAAVKVWSNLVEYTARYSRELNNELMNMSAGSSSANRSIKNLLDFANKELDGLAALPERIAANFKANVRKRERAGRVVD